jgi:hypothetical protein
VIGEEARTALAARIAAAALGVVVVVGLIGAVVAWVRDGGVSSSMAAAYYFIGCIVFLIGSFPSGGFSLVRGKTTRRPTGSGGLAVPSMLLGALLVGFGVVLDVTSPF